MRSSTKDRYKRKHGKLIRTVPVIVDELMESRIKEARENGFNFQEWARDCFTANFDTVLAFCRLEKLTNTLNTVTKRSQIHQPA